MASETGKGIYNRASLLMGDRVMEALSGVRVIVFGVGGVGSWCAEGLVRSGVTHLTIVDSDSVCITNVNRQLMATTRTVGRPKVEVLRERLLEINPEARIDAVEGVYSKENAEQYNLDQYDYVIDCIDSLKDKVALILHATSLPDTVFMSSMGAALRVDPTKIRVAEFREVDGDPLARALRHRFKHIQTWPAKKFRCVYSEELPLPNLGAEVRQDSIPEDIDGFVESRWTASKMQINGSLCHITSIFGMTLAGLVIKDIYGKTVR